MHPEKARKTIEETLNQNVTQQNETKMLKEPHKFTQKIPKTCNLEVHVKMRRTSRPSIPKPCRFISALKKVYDGVSEETPCQKVHHAKCNLSCLTNRQSIVLCHCYTPSVSSIRKKKQLNVFSPLVITVTFFCRYQVNFYFIIF